MFKQRSTKKELLDEADIPQQLLYQNLRELEIINKLLGGIRISLKGLKEVIKSSSQPCIADIGCGGGDAVAAFARYCQKEVIEASFIGIDLKSDCIAYAQQFCAGLHSIHFIQEDYRVAIANNKKITHVHAALFCHHLTDNELLELILFCQAQRVTLIINDLERNPLAYWSIWALTRLFNGSKLVKNDAPLSVLRGFKKKEWEILLQKAKVKTYSISWQWAFRHLIIIRPA